MADKPADGTDRRPIPAPWSQAARRVVFGYVCAAVFVASFLIWRSCAPDLGVVYQLLLAFVLTAPLLAAGLADWFREWRIAGLRLGLTTVEISLERAAAEIPALAGADIQSAIAGQEHLSSSGNSALKAWFDEFHRRFADRPGVVIHLEPAGERIPYWWSTRLYLVAALLSRATEVRTFYFVDGGKRPRYVGRVPVEDLLHRFAQAWPRLPEAFRACASGKTAADDKIDVGALINHWGAAWPEAVAEAEMKERMGAKELADRLGGAFDTEAIDRHAVRGNELMHRILVWGTRFVPLTAAGRFWKVVDAYALARGLSLSELERRLG